MVSVLKVSLNKTYTLLLSIARRYTLKHIVHYQICVVLFFYQLIKSKTKIQIEKHRLYVSIEKTTINSAKCATTVVHMTRTVHLHRNDVSTVLSHRAITSMTRTLSYQCSNLAGDNQSRSKILICYSFNTHLKRTTIMSVNCEICLDSVVNSRILKCGHVFCTDFDETALTYGNRCPVCKEPQGVVKGNKPDGQMHIPQSEESSTETIK